MAENPAPRVIVVGSTMIDMITYAQRIPDAGETVVGDAYAQGFGGKGANQAVMAARTGVAVTMVNCVGSDALGDATIANFTREGIDVEHITRTDQANTGVAPIWVEPDGTNRIICVLGANTHMTPEQARTAVLSHDRVDVVVGQFEIPQPVTAAGFRAAKDRDAVTVLSPAPADRLEPALAEVTDWLIPNEVELAHLARDHGLSPQLVDDKLIARLADVTNSSLIVTLGAQGAAICRKGGTVTRIPVPTVHAIDTTGAGDAFVGAFVSGLAEGLSTAAAVQLGCACAAVSVTRAGTQSSYPSADELATLRQRSSIAL